jgi:hypothetical protein
LATAGLRSASDAVDFVWLADSRQILVQEIKSLTATLTEIRLNHCDSDGLDAPLVEALTDAVEWQEWVSGTLRDKLAQSDNERIGG